MRSSKGSGSSVKLHESVDRYRILVQELKDFAVFMLDVNGNIVSWNAGARRILGYDDPEIIGHPLAQIFTPEDVSAGIPAQELATAERVGRADDDRWHIRKDGSRFWAAGSTSAYRNSAGELMGFAKIVRDGTEKRRANEALRESEARYRVSFEVSPLGQAHADATTGRLLQVNPAFCRMTGYATDELLAMSFSDLAHPEVRADDRDAFGRLGRGEIPLHTGDRRYVRKNGEVAWFHVTATIVRDADGGPIHLLAVIEDISDRKAAETERQHLLDQERTARADAESANRIKDEFLAVVSHELRTPLTSVMGWVNLLRLKPGDAAELGEGLEVIERNTKAQARLIDDLLDVSRIVAGKLRLDVSPIELPVVIEAAAEAVGVAADAKGIALKLDLDPAAGAVPGDAGRLQQVFWNLLVNAVKFTPKGGAIAVRLQRVHSHVEVRVSDTGQGIAPSMLPYVFDRFRQAEDARRQGGLGLGLSIVRHLVELHGGTVHAASGGEGHGATFTVTLPLLAVRHDGIEAVGQQPKKKAGAPCGEVGRDLSGVRVLVVEDEADARRMIVKALRSCRADVTAASSAAEALAAIQQSKPDVIVCDVGIPDEDGYSLMRKVRALDAKHGGQVPAVALTGYAGLDDRRKALEAGFQMHVAKPVTLSELASVVCSLAGLSPSQGE